MTDLTLENISVLLESNGIAHTTYVDKERIYFNSKEFTEYIQIEKSGFSVRVYLKSKKFGDSYEKADWRKCFSRKDEIHEMLQGVGLDTNKTTTITEGESNE